MSVCLARSLDIIMGFSGTFGDSGNSEHRLFVKNRDLDNESMRNQPGRLLFGGGLPTKKLPPSADSDEYSGERMEWRPGHYPGSRVVGRILPTLKPSTIEKH